MAQVQIGSSPGRSVHNKHGPSYTSSSSPSSEEPVASGSRSLQDPGDLLLMAGRASHPHSTDSLLPNVEATPRTSYEPYIMNTHTGVNEHASLYEDSYTCTESRDCTTWDPRQQPRSILHPRLDLLGLEECIASSGYTGLIESEYSYFESPALSSSGSDPRPHTPSSDGSILRYVLSLSDPIMKSASTELFQRNW